MDVSYALMILKNARERLLDKMGSESVYTSHGAEGIRLFRGKLEKEIASLDYAMDILRGDD